jgi:DNA topoisomerase-1
VFTVDLSRALALFAEPKRGGRRQQTRRVIRQIDGTDGGKALQVLEGRYGPYVSDGETNASIPRGTDPATISLEDARALIDARRGAPPREARRGRVRAKAGAPKAPKVRKAPEVPEAPRRAKAAKPKLVKRKIVH